MKFHTRYLEVGRLKNVDFPFYIYTINCIKNEQPISAHWHEELEILYTDCEGIIEVDEEVIHFDKGSFVFVNKEQLHMVRTYTAGNIYALVFDFGFIEFKNNDFCQNEILNKLKNKKLLFPKASEFPKGLYKEISGLLAEIISLYYSDITGRELKIKCNLYQLIFSIYTNRKFMFSMPENESYSAPQLSYVKDTILYMENNYAAPITIEELAKNINVSKYYLIKVFKLITGETPIIYLRNLRLDISKDFLSQGYSVTEAALMSGFGSLSYYIRKFREKNTISPKEYRSLSLN